MEHTQISIVISVIALCISLLTFWLTRFKKGNIKMTKPTVIFFDPDSGKENNGKIFIRTLLYSTSDSGVVQTKRVILKKAHGYLRLNC